MFIEDLDYIFSNITIIFNGSYSVGDSECVIVNAFSDNLVEGTEKFYVQVDSFHTVPVFIIDNDCKYCCIEQRAIYVCIHALTKRFFNRTQNIIFVITIHKTHNSSSAQSKLYHMM